MNEITQAQQEANLAIQHLRQVDTAALSHSADMEGMSKGLRALERCRDILNKVVCGNVNCEAVELRDIDNSLVGIGVNCEAVELRDIDNSLDGLGVNGEAVELRDINNSLVGLGVNGE